MNTKKTLSLFAIALAAGALAAPTAASAAVWKDKGVPLKNRRKSSSSAEK